MQADGLFLSNGVLDAPDLIGCLLLGNENGSKIGGVAGDCDQEEPSKANDSQAARDGSGRVAWTRGHICQQVQIRSLAIHADDGRVVEIIIVVIVLLT